MPITTAKNQEEFDYLLQSNGVVVVLFCSKFDTPIDVMKSFGRLSLKIPEYRFCFIDLRKRPDISSRIRITGNYVISVYRAGTLAKSFTVADMEFYSSLTTMDKVKFDRMVSQAIQSTHGLVDDEVDEMPLPTASTPPPVIENTTQQAPAPEPALTSAASGSASVTLGANTESYSHTQGNYQPFPAHMPVPFGTHPSMQPTHPMYMYSSYHYPHPPPPSPNNAAGYGSGYSGNININTSNNSASDSGRLVGTHLSELIAVKVAEKISSQGGVPPSGRINISVNIDVNVNFQ